MTTPDLTTTPDRVRFRLRISVRQINLALWWGWWAVLFLHVPAALVFGWLALISGYAWIAVGLAAIWAYGAVGAWRYGND
jgi:hypothetical protein